MRFYLLKHSSGIFIQLTGSQYEAYLDAVKNEQKDLLLDITEFNPERRVIPVMGSIVAVGLDEAERVVGAFYGLRQCNRENWHSFSTKCDCIAISARKNPSILLSKGIVKSLPVLPAPKTKTSYEFKERNGERVAIQVIKPVGEVNNE